MQIVNRHGGILQILPIWLTSKHNTSQEATQDTWVTCERTIWFQNSSKNIKTTSFPSGDKSKIQYSLNKAIKYRKEKIRYLLTQITIRSNFRTIAPQTIKGISHIRVNTPRRIVTTLWTNCRRTFQGITTIYRIWV